MSYNAVLIGLSYLLISHFTFLISESDKHNDIIYAASSGDIDFPTFVSLELSSHYGFETIIITSSHIFE
jgi:hypothetical protein